MEPQNHNEPAALQASADGTIALNHLADNMAHQAASAASVVPATSTAPQSRAANRGLRIAAWSLLALCVVIVGGAYGAYTTWANGGRIAPGVFVQGENLSGLTPLDARRQLSERFGRLFVEVKAPDRTFKMSLKELGGEPQIQAAVKNAFWFGRSRGVVQNAWNVMASRRKEKRMPLPVRWNKNRLRQKMWAVATLYNQEPQDAKLLVTDGIVQVVQEQQGRSLNVGETLLQLQKKYYVGLPSIEATVRATAPRITAASLEGTDVKIGEYSTRFDSGLWGRTRNIYVAAAAVDGKVLMPSETFSFNQSTGERTWEKGYRMAHIFERKPGETEAEVVDGLAGGTCQVSSTLFNAVRKANNKTDHALRIVERNYHSLPVTYVPSGLDATVAWPYKDFKFRNKLPYPIYLRAIVSGSRLHVSVWGRVPNGAQSVAVPASDETDSSGETQNF